MNVIRPGYGVNSGKMSIPLTPYFFTRSNGVWCLVLATPVLRPSYQSERSTLRSDRRGSRPVVFLPTSLTTLEIYTDSRIDVTTFFFTLDCGMSKILLVRTLSHVRRRRCRPLGDNQVMTVEVRFGPAQTGPTRPKGRHGLPERRVQR